MENDHNVEESKNTINLPSIHPFDLGVLVEKMKQEEIWEKSGRNSRMLSKLNGLRLVLNTMKAGTEIMPHQAKGPISVQCIEGQMIFNTEGTSVVLKKGELLTLPENIRHSVEAIKETSFLLTLALPN